MPWPSIRCRARIRRCSRSLRLGEVGGSDGALVAREAVHDDAERPRQQHVRQHRVQLPLRSARDGRNDARSGREDEGEAPCNRRNVSFLLWGSLLLVIGVDDTRTANHVPYLPNGHVTVRHTHSASRGQSKRSSVRRSPRRNSRDSSCTRAGGGGEGKGEETRGAIATLAAASRHERTGRPIRILVLVFVFVSTLRVLVRDKAMVAAATCCARPPPLLLLPLLTSALPPTTPHTTRCPLAHPPLPVASSSSSFSSIPTQLRHPPPYASSSSASRSLRLSAAMNPNANHPGYRARVAPGPGQESVWDYPRPPRVERVGKRVQVEVAGVMLADSENAWRVLETSHPPVYYIPQEDIQMQYVQREEAASSFCEWKGPATYWTVTIPQASKHLPRCAWSYERPTPLFQPIASHLAFYCAPMDTCRVGGEIAEPQPGGFYGGWVTKDIVGPFKGGPGSWGW
ncbi:unnamed protein product [Closterium sp. NIES-54]